jgi:hypothetical protein
MQNVTKNPRDKSDCCSLLEYRLAAPPKLWIPKDAMTTNKQLTQLPNMSDILPQAFQAASSSLGVHTAGSRSQYTLSASAFFKLPS